MGLTCDIWGLSPPLILPKASRAIAGRVLGVLPSVLLDFFAGSR
jgi:hypothetical protein